MAAHDTLIETWVESRPLDERIDALSALKDRRGSASHISSFGEENGIAAREPFEKGRGIGTAVASEFETRVQSLSAPVQDRLLIEAVRRKAGISAETEARFTTRIADNNDPIASTEIEENTSLQPHQKARLLRKHQEAVRLNDRKLRSIEWLRTPVSWDALPVEDQDFAELAFDQLNDGAVSTDILADAFVREKKVLPKSYVSTLLDDVNSQNGDTVIHAYNRLAALAATDPIAVQRDKRGDDLVDAEAKWRLLSDVANLSENDAAQQLMSSSGVQQRQHLKSAFDDRLLFRTTDILDVAAVLAVVGRSSNRASHGEG